MPIERTEQYKWEHHTGAYAYLDGLNSPMIGKDNKPKKQGHLHVFVKPEHRGNEICKELINKVVSDLAKDNLKLPKEERIYRVISKKHSPQKKELESAVKAYEKAGFKKFDCSGMQVKYVGNY